VLEMFVSLHGVCCWLLARIVSSACREGWHIVIKYAARELHFIRKPLPRVTALIAATALVAMQTISQIPERARRNPSF